MIALLWFVLAVLTAPFKSKSDLPPLKWSSLMYVFDRGGYGDGKEEAYG